jgi:diguanylate cyclase (GGDEF)-like protein
MLLLYNNSEYIADAEQCCFVFLITWRDIMYNSNVTEYKNLENEYHMYFGKISIKKGLYITNFDESFFHMVGMKIYVSITDIMHPDDVEPFVDAVGRLDAGPQHLFFRLMCLSDDDTERYRYFYGVLTKNGKVIEGEDAFDIELSEIMAISKQYKWYRSLITKYREYMSMSHSMYLEYEYATDILQLYEYKNRQSHPIYNGTLDELKIAVDAADTLDAKQKLEFEVFYSTVTRGQDHALIQLDTACFLNNAMKARLEIMTGVIYDEDARGKMVGLVTAIGDEQPNEKYYMSDSAYDPGTGLLNKRAINEYAVEKIQNQTSGLCLVIIDLDDFKKINDNFGHMAGDEVLSKVAEIMKSVVQNRGAVGRFGGDEFMIVLERIFTQMDLRRVLATICANVRWAYDNPNGPKVTLSIGASMYPVDGDSYEELFRKADKCVYIAKAKGKDRFIMYDEEKHGALVMGEGERTNIGIKATYSDDKKNDIVSDLIKLLYTDGMNGITQVMQQMQAYFDIDGIAIYGGEKLERICSVGKYINPIESLAFAKDEEYQRYFNEQGFYEESKMFRLEKKIPEAFRLYTGQENGKFIQCEVLDGESVPKTVVSFDFFNRSPKHGTTDIGLMKIVGRMIAEVAAKGI